MKVIMIYGSANDMPFMEPARVYLNDQGVAFEETVLSAPRNLSELIDFLAELEKSGEKAVILAIAGLAAALTGVVVMKTSLPVIGVPIDSSCLQGLDALLSTVQMPPGVPVATVSIGKPGAKNAGILAVQILALTDPKLKKKLETYKKELAKQVDQKAKKLKDYSG